MNETLLCVSNRGYEVSLEAWKVYARLPDAEADAHGMVRIVDESGEDYLFPSSLFAEIELPVALRERFLAAATS